MKRIDYNCYYFSLDLSLCNEYNGNKYFSNTFVFVLYVFVNSRFL